MPKAIRFIPILLLAVTIVASIAATPAALPEPGKPTATATANAGELRVGWNPVAGAKFYTVGWLNRNDYNRIGSAGDWESAFHYATVPASNTSYTVSGLHAGEEYWAIVGARTARTGGDAPSWSVWSDLATTAGRHSAGFCPITGLPVPAGGYLGVGGTVESPAGSFTLTGVAAPSRITLPYADDPSQLYSPRAGRRFVQVCGNFRHGYSGESRLDPGWKTILDSDAGSGFARVNTHERISTDVTGHGCQIWDVPATAHTAVYAVNISGYSPSNALTGAYDDDIGLYRIDLNTASATLIPLSSQPQTGQLTPMTNQQLVRHVKPALGQIIATNSAGETVSGSGFVVRSSGIMVTNRHMVDDAQTVTVWMNTLDGQTLRLTGNVLGRGILADLAVVQLPAGRTYATLPLADSDAVSGLDEVSAWGYPGGSISGTYPTVTGGIISSKGVYGDVDFLQTDAAINPGNSGGPLIDQYGRVVGVNTMKTVGDTVDNQGFAIASNEVSSRLNTLVNGGRASEMYRNVKYGHGYSVNIPKGWYIQGESRFAEGCTAFSPYHRKSSASLCSSDISNSFVGSTDKLAAFAEWRRNDIVRLVQARGRTLFQPISFTRITIGGREFYRLEYRYQSNPESCISNRVMLMGLSSTDPGHYGFTWRVGVCENSLSQYGAERDAMLNSFRP